MLCMYFPLSAEVRTKGDLLRVVLIYIVVSFVVGSVTQFLRFLPLIGWMARIASKLVGAYCLIGIVLAVLVYNRLY